MMSNSNAGIRRRTILKSCIAVAAIAMPAIARAQAHHIVVASGGGVMDDALDAAYYKPFTKKTGIAVIKAANEYAKLKAMVDAGAVEWDIMQISGDQAALFAKQGLVEPLDWSMIDKNGLLPGVTDPNYVFSDIVASAISWNTKRVTVAAAPTRWSDVWDLKRFPGDRTFWKKASQTLEVALLGDGVAPGALYPLDVPRALRSLDRLKSHISWYTTGAQSVQLLADGEVSAGALWNGRTLGPKLDGAPIDFTFNDALFLADSWLIPRGSKAKREAMKFIAFSLEADNQAEFARRIPYGPVRIAATEQLDPARRAVIPTSSENFAKGTMMNASWWAENGASAVDQFNTWLLT